MGSGAFGSRLVVRVGGVRVHAHVGTVLPKQAFAAHGLAEPNDEVVLRKVARPARTQAAADFKPGFGDDGVDGALRGLVARDLLLAQHRFKLADEIGGGYDLLAEGAEELHGSRIDHRDVHDVVRGRVLHGDLSMASEEVLKACVKLLPTGVEVLRAGQRVEASLLDAVHELARLA